MALKNPTPECWVFDYNNFILNQGANDPTPHSTNVNTASTA
jgi:hypothetical protein